MVDPNLVTEEHKQDIRHALEFYGLDVVNVEDDEDPATGEKRRMVEQAAAAVREARGTFFLAAMEGGLNGHQALHSWDHAIEAEHVNSIALNGEEFCSKRLAQGLGVTPEELLQAHPGVVQFALMAGVTLKQALEELERQAQGGLN